MCASAKATSAHYRTKVRMRRPMPLQGSMELVVDNVEKKERLYYRAVYSGRTESADFNLYENRL